MKYKIARAPTGGFTKLCVLANFLVLIASKVMGWVDWGWGWVIAPLWVPPVLLLVLPIGVMITVVVLGILVQLLRWSLWWV